MSPGADHGLNVSVTWHDVVRDGRIAESATLFKLEEKQRGKHAKVKEYAIQCESPEEKAAWMTSLLNSLDEMNDKRKSAYNCFSFLSFLPRSFLAVFTRELHSPSAMPSG